MRNRNEREREEKKTRRGDTSDCHADNEKEEEGSRAVKRKPNLRLTESKPARANGRAKEKREDVSNTDALNDRERERETGF